MIRAIELVVLVIWFLLTGFLLGIRFGAMCPSWAADILGVILLILFVWFVTHE